MLKDLWMELFFKNIDKETKIKFKKRLNRSYGRYPSLAQKKYNGKPEAWPFFSRKDDEAERGKGKEAIDSHIFNFTE